jgi:arylsulfatase
VTKPFRGTINVDIRDSVPDWEPYAQPTAPEGAPNVVYIVLDDVGFSAMEPWGGLIETPNINRIAAQGLGRNHTTNGMACIAETTSGFPGSNGDVPFECAMPSTTPRRRPARRQRSLRCWTRARPGTRAGRR